MRYEVRFQKSGVLKKTTDDLGVALFTAQALDKWNHPCDVVDTQTGEIIYTGEAWADQEMT